MAVTTEKSTEYTNATATPVVNNNTTEQHGRVRIAFFTHTQSGAGDATSSVALCKLPPGRVRVLASLSRAYVNWTTSSATLDLGWDAHTNLSGTAVVADPNGLIDGLAVDTVGFQTLEGAVAANLLTGGTYVLESKDGVVIRATSQDTAIASGDDLVGYICYVLD
jgi:hypothetical protein|tara:strand:- start:489 stop:983 length:495 start_codon:yes stop_codon:yes gene_type:complete